MTHANAALPASPLAGHQTQSFAPRIEQAGVFALAGSAMALQFSIAIAQALLAIAIALWIALVVLQRERIDMPRFGWALVAYGVLTLASAARSINPAASFADTKQLALFLVVPVAYRLMSGTRGLAVLTLAMSAGAAS